MILLSSALCAGSVQTPTTPPLKKKCSPISSFYDGSIRTFARVIFLYFPTVLNIVPTKFLSHEINFILKNVIHFLKVNIVSIGATHFGKTKIGLLINCKEFNAYIYYRSLPYKNMKTVVLMIYGLFLTPYIAPFLAIWFSHLCQTKINQNDMFHRSFQYAIWNEKSIYFIIFFSTYCKIRI